MKLQESVNKLISAAQKEADRYTYPIFKSDFREKPDLIATSVIVRANDKHYLITASHVMEHFITAGSPFMIGVNEQYVSIEGEFILSNHESKDHFDIAYTVLPAITIKNHTITALSSKQLVVDNSFVNVPVAFIHGFPNSRNKQFKSLLNTMSFKVNAYAYAGIIINNFQHWEDTEKSTELHTCMTYDKKSGGNSPPSPKGVSGGGLWIVPDLSNPLNIQLDSIFIEYHKQYAVTFSTKISQIMSFINSTGGV